MNSQVLHLKVPVGVASNIKVLVTSLESSLITVRSFSTSPSKNLHRPFLGVSLILALLWGVRLIIPLSYPGTLIDSISLQGWLPSMG